MLAVSALVILGACKDDASAPAAKPSESAPQAQADASDNAPATPPGQDDANSGSGLTGAVHNALGSAKASRATRLFSEDATVVVSVDVAAFVQQPLFESLRNRLGPRPRAQLDAATLCGVGPDKWRTFVIGVDPNSANMAMVTEAEGVGTKTALQCLAKEIGTFTLADDGKRLSDRTGGGIVLDDDAIAFATPAWMTTLADRIDGKSKAPTPGALDALLARTDATKPLWFAAVVPPMGRSMARGMLGSDPIDVTGSVSLAGKVGLQLAITVSDAKAAHMQLHSQWNAFKGLAMANGVPQAVADSVKLGQAGETVTVELSASYDDVETLLTKFMPRR